MLKGALVGAGALAALALPTPLLDIMPSAGPKKALASNQNIKDGIYAFRYFPDSGWSLDVPDARNYSTDVNLTWSNNSRAQYCIVSYEVSTDSYKIMPMCDFDTNLVLSISGNTAKSGAVINTQEDKARKDQRWVFKNGLNGSYHICSKSNPSYCIDHTWATIEPQDPLCLSTYSSRDASTCWKAECFIEAIDSDVKTVGLDTIYPGTCYIEKIRDCSPKLETSLTSGWTATYDSSGGLDSLSYKGVYGAGSVDFTVSYEDCADINGRPVDLRLFVSLLGNDVGQSTTDITKTTLSFNWQDRTAAPGILQGLSTTRCSGFDLTYKFIDHETREPVSLKGSQITFGSISGASELSSPIRDFPVWDGVSYRATSTPVKTESYTEHRLCEPCPGFMIGCNSDFENFIGGKDYEKQCVSYQIVNDTPMFSFRFIAGNGPGNPAWLAGSMFPIFTGLGIEKPPAPKKSAKITS